MKSTVGFGVLVGGIGVKVAAGGRRVAVDGGVLVGGTVVLVAVSDTAVAVAVSVGAGGTVGDGAIFGSGVGVNVGTSVGGSTAFVGMDRVGVAAVNPAGEQPAIVEHRINITAAAPTKTRLATQLSVVICTCNSELPAQELRRLLGRRQRGNAAG